MAGSNTFGGTVKLDGESEYRKALSNITAQMNVMRSEMVKVTAEFGKNDTSVDGLTAKNKVLTDQISKQKERIETLKGALESSKNEYGENDKKTLSWQATLNKAEAQLTTMNKELQENEKALKDAANGIEDNSKGIKKFGNESEEAGKKALSLGDIIKANLITDAIRTGISALVNGVSDLASSFTNSISAGASYADNILTLSTQTGLSAEKLQEYNAVAELTDVSMDTLTSSMAKNIKQMAAGNDAYSKLGISVKDTNGQLRDSDEVYWECIDALQGIQNETERDAIAMDLFGKKAQDLNPLIQMGSEGYRELANEAHEMGAVLSNESLEALGAMDDEFQIFKSTVGSTGNILAGAFAPAITEVTSGINGLAQNFNYLISSVINGSDEDIGIAMSNITISLTNVVTSISEQAPKLVEMAGTLINTIVTSIADNAPMLVNAVVNIVSSIATIIVDNLPLILDAGIKILVALVQGLAENLPTIIPKLVESLVFMVDVLLDNIDLIIDAGIQLLIGLTEGLLNALPILIDKLPEIIDKLVIALTNNMPKLIEMGIVITLKLAEGLIKAIPQLISKIPQIISSLLSGFSNFYSKMGDVGKNLISGIWEGIKNSFDWIKGKLKEWIGNVTDFIKKMFGIHSPSTVFRDQIGTNLALGIGEGFMSQMNSVKKDMADAIPTDFDFGVKTNIINPIYNQYDNLDNTNGPAINNSNFNLTINNNSKWISPAEEAKQMRSQAQWFVLNQRRRA